MTFCRWMMAVAALTAVGSANAQTTASEAVLIRSLDRAFKPGLLNTSGVRKNADGTYARSVTTGDAIAKPTFAKPLQTAQAACSEGGGLLTLVLSAGRYGGNTPRAVIQLGDQRLNVDYSLLYSLFANLNSTAFDAGTSGFKPMFLSSPFAGRAAAQADAEPPFGLFTRTVSDGAQLWAIAIMPAGMPFGYDLPIRVTPILQDWIRARNLQSAGLEDSVKRTQIAADRQRQRDADHAQAEARRLGPFRAALKVGSRTNCGIVIAVNDPLVQVQLPPQLTGPSGIRTFWVPREELTDATPPRDCGFGA